MALYAIEAIGATILILIFFVQILLPLFSGEPVFPMLRKRRMKVEKELTEVKEDVSLAEAERVIHLNKQTAEDIRNSLKEERRGDSGSDQHQADDPK